MEIATFSYLDNELVDELWMLVKREGINQQQVDKIKANVQAKISFGVGNILNWLVGDLKGEISGQGAAERSITTTYAAPLRLMLLLELLPVERVQIEEHEKLGKLRGNSFVDVKCPTLTLAPLPRIGEYWHVALTEKVATISDKLEQHEQSEAMLRIIDKYSTHHRAMSFWSRLQELGKSQDIRDRSALTRLVDDYGDTFGGMMSMSDNDLIVGASLSLRDAAPSRKVEDWTRELALAQPASLEDSSVTGIISGLRKSSADRERDRAAQEARNSELTKKALAAARSHSDSLVVTCFEEEKLKRNVAALSTSGDIRLFGRVLTNVLETRTRMITVQPITLSVATET